MHRSRILFTVLAALLVTVSVHAAQEIEQFTVRRESADAFFYRADACTETYVFVFAWEGAERVKPAPSEPGSFVSTSVETYDFCAGEYVVAAYGSTDLGAADFTVEKNLEGASLEASVPAFEYVSGNEVTIYLDISWDAVGPTSRGRSRYTTKSKGFSYSEVYSGTFRAAEATDEGVMLEDNVLDLGTTESAGIVGDLKGRITVKTVH